MDVWKLHQAQDKDNGVNQPGDPDRNENDILIKKRMSIYKHGKRTKKRKSWKTNRETFRWINTKDKDNGVNQSGDPDRNENGLPIEKKNHLMQTRRDK